MSDPVTCWLDVVKHLGKRGDAPTFEFLRMPVGGEPRRHYSNHRTTSSASESADDVRHPEILRLAAAGLESENYSLDQRGAFIRVIYDLLPWSKERWNTGGVFVLTRGLEIVLVTQDWKRLTKRAFGVRDSEIPIYLLQSVPMNTWPGLRIIGSSFLFGEARREAARRYRDLEHSDAAAQQRLLAAGGPYLESPQHAELQNFFRNDAAFLEMLLRDAPPRLDEEV